MLKAKKVNFKDLIMYEDVHIVKEKINFITGQSGCGKSTLLKLFNRTENFLSGEILYQGRDITEIDSVALRKEVKLISQTTFLFSATIKENFNLFYQYCECPGLREEQMERALQLTEANFALDTPCDTLSGGEKQRVYLAICLSMQAEVIMLDEPTSALDFDLAAKVLENIVAYVRKNRLTLIVISHDNKLTERFAEHVINLSGGKTNE